jgi:hypothetical protein
MSLLFSKKIDLMMLITKHENTKTHKVNTFPCDK